MKRFLHLLALLMIVQALPAEAQSPSTGAQLSGTITDPAGCLEVGPFSKPVFASDNLLRMMQPRTSFFRETLRRVALSNSISFIRSQGVQQILRFRFALLRAWEFVKLEQITFIDELGRPIDLHIEEVAGKGFDFPIGHTVAGTAKQQDAVVACEGGFRNVVCAHGSSEKISSPPLQTVRRDDERGPRIRNVGSKLAQFCGGSGAHVWNL